MAGQLIVGLDVSSRARAEEIVALLGDKVDFYKIGYQCFYGADGYALGKELLRAGKKVFFDLKLLDIDNTVEKGVAAIAESGATMLTVHAYPQCMRAAVRGAAGSSLCVLGVSVLTSMDDADVAEAGFARDTAGLVALRAQQARDAGIGGLVSSAHEAEMVRTIVGPKMAIVTPGIRPSGAAMADQKRAMSPGAALAAGATHLVVARPVIEAADPAAAAQAIRAELNPGLRAACCACRPVSRNAASIAARSLSVQRQNSTPSRPASLAARMRSAKTGASSAKSHSMQAENFMGRGPCVGFSRRGRSRSRPASRRGRPGRSGCSRAAPRRAAAGG
jgi:orotidine-5'-phosphate decarboxylase